MTDSLIKLAQDLEWLGCELEYFGHKHALEGFPGAGPTWDSFLEKQEGVLLTAEKVERELKDSVRYNPSLLVGIDYPLKAAIEFVAVLLTAVEDIKETALNAVQDLPSKVRDFSRTVQDQFGTDGRNRN